MSDIQKVLNRIQKDGGIDCPNCGLLASKLAYDEDCQVIVKALQLAIDIDEMVDSHNKLVRELDVHINGEDGAAKQASLCDIVSQLKSGTLPFEFSAKCMMDYLSKNHHPHMKVIIDSEYAEMVEGVKSAKNDSEKEVDKDEKS